MGSEDRLHLGCGKVVVDGWLNVDGSWSVRLARRPLLRKLAVAARFARADNEWDPRVRHCDVRKRLPYADNRFEAVYASHMLEHLYLDEARRLLKECLRVLKPGGVMRVVVPDVSTQVREYIAGGTSLDGEFGIGPGAGGGVPNFALAADVLNYRLNYRRPRAECGSLPLRGYRLLNDFHAHKWMYDEPALVYRFEEAGFADISRRTCFDSRISGIEQIERADRATPGSLVVEGVKPS